MKSYQTPQVVDAGEAADVVLDAKQLGEDNLGGIPADYRPCASVIDSDF